MLRDMYSNFKFFQCIEPQELLAATLTGLDIDTQGFESLTVLVDLGNISFISGASFCSLALQHTDATAAGVASDYAACVAADMIGLPSGTASVATGIFKTIGTGCVNISTCGSRIVPVGYRGTKRFVRVVITGATWTGHGSECIGALAILGYSANWPVNNGETSLIIAA